MSRKYFSAAGVKSVLRSLKKPLFAILYHGKARWCPVCEKSSRKFLCFGDPARKDARCPCCGSLERHRLVWLYFTRMTDLFDGNPKKMLHVAPEPCLESRLRNRLKESYLSADLLNRDAMVQMDVTAIQFPDAYFAVIYCSHVLEHIVDDRQAMREFYRVLKPDGWAILLVPISAEKTMEAAAVTDPAERRKIFGQEDHVRRYGPDYVERLREAGFKVKAYRPGDIGNEEEIKRMGLAAARGDIYYCVKP
jgi:SAM-dependent methyltransferase